MAKISWSIVGIFAVLMLIVVAGIVYWMWPPTVQDAGTVAEQIEPVIEPAPTPTLAEQLSERLAGITLKTSDGIVRELAAGLSANPELVKWLANDDLIRRFTAAVDNIAAGTSPRAHLEFLRPSEGFRVRRGRGGNVVIDPTCYARYDLPAQVFASLDTEGTVALYRELKPLIDEAYREIAPPGRQFDERLDLAFDRLLAVPVLEEMAPVDELVVTYAWADEKIENLSDAQRHFLRMGPSNVRRVQDKLSEIRAALAEHDS